MHESSAGVERPKKCGCSRGPCQLALKQFCKHSSEGRKRRILCASLIDNTNLGLQSSCQVQKYLLLPQKRPLKPVSIF